MNRWISRVSMTLALAAMVSGAAFAGQGKKPAKTHAKAKAPTCSACHMTLSPKKTKTNTVAVKINGKTYYCCDKCKMPKTASAHHPKKGAAKKG